MGMFLLAGSMLVHPTVDMLSPSLTPVSPCGTGACWRFLCCVPTLTVFGWRSRPVPPSPISGGFLRNACSAGDGPAVPTHGPLLARMRLLISWIRCMLLTRDRRPVLSLESSVSLNDGRIGGGLVHICRVAGLAPVAESVTDATWLILPVVICLSQRLSHACVSMN